MEINDKSQDNIEVKFKQNIQKFISDIPTQRLDILSVGLIEIL